MHRSAPLSALLIAVLLAGCTSTDRPSTPADAASPAVAAPAVDYSRWRNGTSEPVADKLYPQRGNPGLDVLHYGLELAWTPADKRLTGTATLRIRPTEDAPQISLDFAGLTVDTVTVDDKPATGTVAKEKLTVPVAVTADRPLTLVVDYHGTPKPVKMPSRRGDAGEGLGLRPTKDGSLWTMQEPWGALTWYPANDHPSDEALYDIAATVPQGWSAVASGVPRQVEGTTFHYSSQDPVASYLVTLAVSKYKKTSAKGPRDLPLVYWTRPGTDDNLLTVLKKSPEHIAFLEQKFGRFPFPSAGVVVVDSRSGMETQQMITLGNGGGRKWSTEIAAAVEGTLVHEYAHQWFGDSVTPTTWTDLWLNEGFAMYAQYLWDQKKLGFPDKVLDDYLRKQDAELRKKSGPPGKPKAGYFAESNVYVCPAAMLEDMHDALGDKKFFALATAWVQEQRNTQQDRASFIAFVNKQTGKDFTKFINTWLDSTATPAAGMKP
jgi:aminopeptidase N